MCFFLPKIMEELYKKISIEKSLPQKEGDYFVFFKYKGKELITTCYWQNNDFHNYDGSGLTVTHWLQEIEAKNISSKTHVIKSVCGNCWGSGWERQFIKPCTECNGTGECYREKLGEYKKPETK